MIQNDRFMTHCYILLQNDFSKNDAKCHALFWLYYEVFQIIWKIWVFQNDRIPKLLDSKMIGFQNDWIPKWLDSEMIGFQNDWIPKWLDSKTIGIEKCQMTTTMINKVVVKNLKLIENYLKKCKMTWINLSMKDSILFGMIWMCSKVFGFQNDCNWKAWDDDDDD